MSDRHHEQTELVRSYLTDLPHDELVSMTLTLAEDDRAVWTYLVGCARVSGGRLDVRELKKELTVALRASGHVDWRRAREYAARAEAAIGVIRTALAAGHAAAAVELTEHAVARLDTAMNHIDDSGGHLGLIREMVEELHRLACVIAKPDPVKLGRRLCAISLRSGWEWFLDGPVTHREALGEEGLRAYRARLQPEWDRVTHVPPGEHSWRGGESYDRFLITHLRESLARADGDVDELVEVMSRDLSSPWRFVEIADELAAAGRERESVAWLERGMRAYPPDGQDSRLRRSLVDAYLRDGLMGDALAIVEAIFDRKPGALTYEELRHVAQTLPDWAVRRAAALDVLRERGGGDGRGALIRVLIDEGLVEDAWREAQEGGCSERHWHELAELRRAEHPQDILPVYRRMLAGVLSHADVRNYREAVELLKRIEDAHAALGDPAGFRRDLDAVRTDQKRRPKLIGMLDRQWPPTG